MANDRKNIRGYPDISFIDNISFSDLQEQMIRDFEEQYQELTGKEVTLAAADPFRMILYACAVALYQGYQYEDRAGKMGLLKYSSGEYLDNLGALKGVTRKEAVPAQVTLQFTLAEHISQTAVIPKGTRVKGIDLYFETAEEGRIQPGELTADVTAVCQTAGTDGNGLKAGEIAALVDPLPYTLSVTNTGASLGGADRETDEELAERIYLSPASYSTAGPLAAYEYWVKTFSSAIGECRILSEAPGEVDIYITVGGELPDDGFVKQLEEYLQDHSIRPLTDHVVVKKPETVNYNIEFTYYISNDNRSAEETIKKAVEAAKDSYISWQKKVGRDVTPARLVYEVMQAGAQSVDITSPAYTKVEQSQLALPESITLHYGGLRDD